MSRLNLRLRPVVAFNVENKEHRELYARFICTGSWAGCPYTFEVDEPNGELQGTIQRKLLQYYGAKEFKLDVVDNRY
jgi:hypothetical protein